MSNDGGHGRWLVGVDGSSTSHHALRWALAQAVDRQVTVAAIRCWAPLEGSPDDPRPDEELIAIERHLDDLRADLGPEASDLQTLPAHGRPASELLHHATTAALLVLGTRGMDGFQRLLLGSVGLQVATHSPIPTAIVPPTAALDGALNRVVVGFDGSRNAQAALAWSLGFARPETTIEAVGAWEPPTLATRVDAGRFAERSAASPEAFQQGVADIVASSVSTASSVAMTFEDAKPAADALLDHAATADLLVVGARGRGAIIAAILGSVTNRLLHQAPCPIVVVPEP